MEFSTDSAAAQKRCTSAREGTRRRAGLLEACCSSPVSAVEGAVLDGFAEVFGSQGWGAFEVGDGARDFQDAIVGASGEAEALDGRFEDFSPSAVMAQCLRMSLGGICELA